MSSSGLVPPTPNADEHAALNSDKEIERALLTESDPMTVFATWFKHACDSEPRDPHAMVLATAGSDGTPDARVVLMRTFDEAGFVFYTNTQSTKGEQMRDNPRASACFYWRSLLRQVRVSGPVETVSDAEADAYFAQRARDSQIGAWASDQSRPMSGRSDLEARVSELEARYDGGDVPRPPHWTGYRLIPLAIEFWRERPFRLHTRRHFARPAFNAPWDSQLLFP